MAQSWYEKCNGVTQATLEVHISAERRNYQVTFAREQDAIDFLARKAATCVFYEINDEDGEQGSIPPEWTELLAAMYPQCHHQMSASMCMDPYGPHHFGTYEQERQREGY